MDGGKNGATRKSKVLQSAYYTFSHVRVKTASWFIDEQQRRISQHLEKKEQISDGEKETTSSEQSGSKLPFLQNISNQVSKSL